MKRKTIFLILLILVIPLFFGAWKILGPSVSAPDNFFYIRTGESFKEMKSELLEKKFISNDTWFNLAASLLKFKTARPGKYKLESGMSIFEMIRMLKNGRQSPVNLVITKFRVKEDLARRCGSLFEFDSLQFMQAVNKNEYLLPMGLDTNTLMAAILPDTYTFYWNTTPQKVFQKLRDESEKFWTEERKARARKKGITPNEAITLASIVDEESNFGPEKGNIASVYLNRLKKNMPLQADPTIKFAMKNFGLKRVYEKHLWTPSPYNTYRNTGLPPGPICTPQPQTIDAVLNAPETDYLYFVAKSDFSGSHVFTSEYRDHLNYAREFQKAMDRQEMIRNKK
jgi:UPF0755 protein